MSKWEAGYAFESMLQTPLDFYEVKYANGQTIRYEKRPQGKWVLDAVSPHSISWFRCSYCGYKYDAYKQSNFCPNCGADMRKEGESN